MKTMYEMIEEKREEKLYFLRQRLFAVIILITSLAMFWVSRTTVSELSIGAVVLLGIGLLLLFTKEKALG